LSDGDSGLNFATPFVKGRGCLPLRVAADIASSLFDCVLELWIRFLPSLVKFVFWNAERFVFLQSVETRGVAPKCAIAVATDVCHNVADSGLHIGEVGGATSGEGIDETILRGAFENVQDLFTLPTFVPESRFGRHHITTLFRGYSTIP
jgi:hypothetical protein